METLSGPRVGVERVMCGRKTVLAMLGAFLLLLAVRILLYDLHNYTIQIDIINHSPSTLPVEKSDNSQPMYTSDIRVTGYERPHPELCPNLGEHLRLLVLITSAPSHFDLRDAVRRRWRQYASRTDVTFAFALGIPPQELQSRIETEDILHGDIIMARFVDCYSNLTLKTLSMLEWVDKYCPNVSFLAKTDDDTYINVKGLLSFTEQNFSKVTKTIWGNVWRGANKNLSNKSKYYVSSLQYSGKQYPTYTSGMAYIMTTDCVRPLLEAAAEPMQPYVHLEDVFVTGVLASRAHIQRVNFPGYYNTFVITGKS